MNSRLKQLAALWVSPSGCLTDTLNPTWSELFQLQANPPPDYLQTLAQAFPTNSGVTLKFSRPTPSPCKVLLAPPPKVIRSHPLLSPQSGHSSGPSHPPLPRGLLQNLHVGSPCPTFIPLQSVLCTEQPEGALQMYSWGVSLLVFHPTRNQIHHPHQGLQGPSGSGDPFASNLPAALASRLQPAGHTGLNHTCSCPRASDPLAPSTSSLGCFLVIQV